jgi:hypothetical protein
VLSFVVNKHSELRVVGATYQSALPLIQTAGFAFTIRRSLSSSVTLG